MLRFLFVAQSVLNKNTKILPRYVAFLQETVAEESTEAPQAIAQEVARFWKAGPDWAGYVQDKLNEFGVLTPREVLRCALAAGDKSDILRFKDTNVWDRVRSIYATVRIRVAEAKAEIAAAAKAASSATEGEMDTAAERLDKAREDSKTAIAELNEVIAGGFKLLVELYAAAQQLRGEDEHEEDLRIIEWRVLGMIQEIGRRNCDFLSESTTSETLKEVEPSAATETVTQCLDFATSDILLPD